MRFFFASILSLITFFTFSQQIVEETIYLDRDSVTYQVVYQPTLSKKIFSKKIAVFANDTTVKAIGKNYTYDYLNGIYRAYYPSGKIMLFANYSNNHLYGDWTWYDEGGDVITKGQYKKGKGIKHGYWAYRSTKTYGRYKKGIRNGRWTQYDVNGEKHRSFYRKGKLLRGKGIDDEINLYQSPQVLAVESDTIERQTNVDESVKEGNSKEYEQAILFVTRNVVFRKALKAHFGTTFKEVQQLKKNYKSGKFQFALAPSIINLDMASFIKESQEGKIEVAVLDSVLKNNLKEVKNIFNGKGVGEKETLYQASTDTTSLMVVYFSEIHQNLMRIDVLKYEATKEKDELLTAYQSAQNSQKFKIMLYFNDQGELKGAEYQK